MTKPNKKDWDEILTELKRIFPEVEDQTTRGIINRNALFDCVGKVLFILMGVDLDRKFDDQMEVS